MQRLSQTCPPQLVVEANDEQWGRLGWVVIDRTVHGSASGGTRFASDVSVEELSGLARAMTYKWALLNVPMGGAKAGITASPEQLGCSRTTLMEAFGRAISALVKRQVYYPGIDLGTTLDDLRAIMRGAGQPLPEEQIDGSYCTALTVFETIRQTFAFQAQSLAGQTVALEGFGKVGSVLAELLAQADARLVAVSTAEGAVHRAEGLDVTRLLELRRAHGDKLVAHYPEAQRLSLDAIFALPVDLVIPGARPWAIHTGNAAHVLAQFVVPISNIPVTPEAEALLLERKRVVLPDFLANCGGILASNMLSNGFNLDEARWVVEGVFADVVRGILQQARATGQSISHTARAVAWARHVALNDPKPGGNRWHRAQQMGHEEGAMGLWSRLAWRIYRRWPTVTPTVRRAALRRFAELSLGATRRQLAEMRDLHGLAA